MANNTSPQPKRPVARFFIGLIKLIGLLLIIATGAVMGIAGWQQMSSSAQATQYLGQRIDSIKTLVVDEGKIESMILSKTSELNSRINSLSTELAAVERENGVLQDQVSSLSATVDAQAAELTAVAGEQEALDGRLTTTEEDAGTLGSAAQALQSDVSSLGQGLDLAGAGLDELYARLNELEGNVTALEASAAVTSTVEVAVVADESTGEDSTVAVDLSNELAILRLTGLVMRTKLHIAEEDIAAAEASLETAQAAAAQNDSWTEVQDALDSAAADLGGKPALANLSLDEALDALDAALAP